MPDRRSSAERLREKLASRDSAMRVYLTEALYHAQVKYTCHLLDVVDEVADSVTAERITDAIYERLAGEGAEEAAERVRERQAEYEEIMTTAGPHRLIDRENHA